MSDRWCRAPGPDPGAVHNLAAWTLGAAACLGLTLSLALCARRRHSELGAHGAPDGCAGVGGLSRGIWACVAA